MSKFTYQAEGEINSQYLLGLLQEYFACLLQSNDTKGIVEDDFKIGVKGSRFARWIKDKFKRFKYSDALIENYNKVLSTQYINEINDRLQIFVQTNVLDARQVYDLKQILKAINFEVVIPELEENRAKAISQSENKFLKCLNDIKYLQFAVSEYVLFDSPVSELKPFLSEKVGCHKANHNTIQSIVQKFVDLRHAELTASNFEPYEVQFKSSEDDFYAEKITDNGVGEDIEAFIRSKMLEKINIAQQLDKLPEDNNEEMAKIDMLLKRLKLYKIEQMLQQLIKLKLNLARAKEVVDTCKDTINQSTISNKASIFLIMDNLYYKLSKKCETLQQKIKSKLQLVDKQKVFEALEQMQNPTSKKTKKNKTSKVDQTEDKQLENSHEIPSNLYDDEDDGEIHISEDDGTVDAEDEIVINEEK